MEQAIETAVQRAIVTMRDHLGEPITVDDMARAAMFSKFHFTRIFQQATGVSPGRFLSALRLQRAKHLLVSTSMNVADISLQVGYNSVGTFSSRFSRSVGMSPTTFRRRAGLATRIATDSERHQPNPSNARVCGRIWQDPGQPCGQVFLGLFPHCIPEGRPVRCAVLPEAGTFRFERVPTGTYYLLAQCVVGDAAVATTQPDGAHASLSVATHGPHTIRHDSVVRADVMLQPVRDLDPPVLLALVDARRMALARVEAEDGRPEPGTPLRSRPPSRNVPVRPNQPDRPNRAGRTIRRWSLRAISR
ncbi:helix-turn-helix domain-containing protein [Plantactinospora sp. GCM10030261]|uniref:helix-turn-helix domain-containing protein n=1 Tax=Plantactinospora sp. GCM10030261 TaxID=3273420 RepID=UPI00361BA64A